jgi:outer membrane protein assembly factor BamB
VRPTTRSRTLAVALASLALLGACSRHAPATARPARRAPEEPRASTTAPPTAEWERTLGAAPGLLAADARGAVVATERALVGLGVDGRVRWRAAVAGAAREWPAIDGSAAAVVTRPDGAAAQLAVVDRSSGEVAWRRRLPAPGAAVSLADDLVVAVTVDGSVLASTRAGAPRWRAELGGAVSARGGLVVDPSTATVATVVTRRDRTLLVLLDARSGDDRGGLDLGPPAAGGTSAVSLVGPGRLVVGTVAGEVVVVDLVAREVAWSTALGLVLEPASRPAVGGGIVVVGSVDGVVVALDARAGATRWRRRVGAPLFGVWPQVLRGVVAVADWGGTLHLLAAADGRRLGVPPVPGAVVALAAAGDRLLASVRLGAPDRVVAWRLRAAGSSPRPGRASGGLRYTPGEPGQL